MTKTPLINPDDTRLQPNLKQSNNYLYAHWLIDEQSQLYCQWVIEDKVS
jgi:hypothetical protein